MVSLKLLTTFVLMGDTRALAGLIAYLAVFLILIILYWLDNKKKKNSDK